MVRAMAALRRPLYCVVNNILGEHPGNSERSGGNFLMHFNGQNKNVLGSKFVWGPYQIISKLCPVQVVTFPDKLPIEITF